MNKIDVAGLKIDALTKPELLKELGERLKSNQKTFITTLYSEFLYHGLQDPALMETLNSADFAVPDGIGILWAAKFLSLPLTAKSYWGKIFQAMCQVKYSLAAIVFNPRWIKSIIPEKIVGANLVWDLAELATKKNYSIYLLGGYADTPKIVSEKLISNIAHSREFNKDANIQLNVAGWSNKNPDDPSVIDDVNKIRPDLLFVAFGPIRQEKWIFDNLSKLNIKLAIGVGGTFDYMAGIQKAPPAWVRNIGLEWLWRLFTQPKRRQRILHATFGLVTSLIRYKVFSSLPYRKNVVSVIFNRDDQILIALRNPKDKDLRAVGDADVVKFKNYWQFPQGGVNRDESLVETAKRENLEELGINNLELIKISAHTFSYEWKNGKRPLFFNIYHYKGQSQNLIYFKFSGTNAEIKTDQKEFIEYKWVPLNNLEEAVHIEKKPLVKIIQSDLEEMREKAII